MFMGIFGKKEDEFGKDGENFREGRKITRKLKDLNPENKKKRKELPKPWGKKERIIVLVVLIVTTIISGILLFTNSAQLGKEGFHLRTPSFSLKSINIFKGETIVVEKK